MASSLGRRCRGLERSDGRGVWRSGPPPGRVRPSLQVHVGQEDVALPPHGTLRGGVHEEAQRENVRTQAAQRQEGGEEEKDSSRNGRRRPALTRGAHAGTNHIQTALPLL